MLWCRTPFRGQAVKQSAEMRSALEFFATAQLYCERALESVSRVESRVLLLAVPRCERVTRRATTEGPIS